MLKCIINPLFEKSLIYITMKTFIKILNLLILIILVHGCKKETDCGDQTTITNFYYVSNEYKSKIPYSGNDTIIYASDANDTAKLICSEKKIYFEEYIQNIGSNDCQRKAITKYENIIFDFIDTKRLFNSFSVNFNRPNLNGTSPYFTSINLTINNTLSVSNSFEYLKNTTSSKDSVSVGNIYYLGNYIDDENKFVLYNNIKGFLKFKTLDNKKWTLIK